MGDEDRIQEQLLDELVALRQRIAELQANQSNGLMPPFEPGEGYPPAVSLQDNVVLLDLDGRFLFSNLVLGGLAPRQQQRPHVSHRAHDPGSGRKTTGLRLCLNRPCGSDTRARSE